MIGGIRYVVDEDEDLNARYRGLAPHRYVPLSSMISKVESNINKQKIAKGLRLHLAFMCVFVPLIFVQTSVGRCHDLIAPIRSALENRPFPITTEDIGKDREIAQGWIVEQYDTTEEEEEEKEDGEEEYESNGDNTDAQRATAPVFAHNTYAQIHSERDYFLWVTHVVLPFLYASSSSPSSSSSSSLNVSPFTFTVGGSTHLLWGARFRQVRVFSTPCSGCTHSETSHSSTALCELYSTADAGCMQPFSEGNEATSKHAYGRCNEPSEKGGIESRCLYEWEQAQVLQEPYIRGQIGTYPGSGFTVTLPLNESLARARVEIMADKSESSSAGQDGFIGSQTRAVVLMMTYYNPSTALFVTVRSLVEVSSSGTYFPSLNFQCGPVIVELERFPAMIIFNILTNGFILIFIFNVVRDLLNPQQINWWTMVDIASAVLLSFQIHFSITYFVLQLPQAYAQLDAAMQAPDQFYAGVGLVLDTFNFMQGIYALSVILECLQVLALLRQLKGFEVVINAAVTAMYDIFFFLPLLGILVSGFAVAGHLFFSASSLQFRSFLESAETTLRLALRAADYYSLSTGVLLGQYFMFAFGFIFVIIFMFLLLNLFRAVILTSWNTERLISENKIRHQRNSNGYNVVKHFHVVINSVRNVARSPSSFKGECILLGHYLFGLGLPGWLSHSQIRSRLRRWRSQDDNTDTHYINFVKLREILQGDGNHVIEVRNSQVDSLILKLKEQAVSEDEAMMLTQQQIRRTKGESPGGGTHIALEGGVADSDGPSIVALRRLHQSLEGLATRQKQLFIDVERISLGLCKVQSRAVDSLKTTFISKSSE